MNENLKKILKFISRTAGFFLINFGVALILLAFFVNSSISNIDVLKNDLNSTVNEEISGFLDENQLDQIREYCRNNSQDSRCDNIPILENKLNQGLDNFFNDIIQGRNYINFLIFSSLIFLIFGFLFVYLGTFDWLNAFHKICIHLAISNFLAAAYINFFPNLFNLALDNYRARELTSQVPQEYVSKASEIILNWLKNPLYLTLKLTIILGIIFLIISLIIYFVKKKALKEQSKDNKKN